MAFTDTIPQIELELQKALELNEFRLYYQPKTDLVSGKIMGVEALIRWKHPKKGLVLPGEFIPIAEETGLIVPIGRWVLRTACAQAQSWKQAGLPPMVLSVNLSVRQLYQSDFVNNVQLILKETKFNPKYLVLEITESILMDKNKVFHNIMVLKHIGVQISLDDFGTGFSSLKYLQNFPVDRIKIDQTFIRNCTSDLNNAAIVKSIIAMAHQLKLCVIAEGIESKDQLVFLQQNLCNIGQGYLFSKPVPPEEFVQHYHQIEQIIPREGIPQEVNDQKLLEEALENARQELCDTVRMQQGMTFKVKEENGKFIHTLCDGELMYQMGLTPEKIIGKELKDFLPISIAEEKTQYFSRAWKGEENVTYEGEINGIYYIATLRPVRRGGRVAEVIGSCVDISKQKWVEEALRISESKYRLIAENIHDLVATFDETGAVLYASPSHEKLLGFTAKEYEKYWAFDLVHPEDIPAVQKEFASMVDTSTPCQVEFRHKHAKGGWIFIEANVTPIFDENNQLKYLLAVGRDISERKRTEELLRKSEKLSVVGQLASSVAHEIRNPLTTIKGFTQLLQKEVGQTFYIESILSEVHRLEDIVNEFLTLAKPQVHRIKETDPIMLFQQVLLFLSSQLMMNDIEIVQEFSLDLPRIYCDRGQIKHAFIHVLQNSIDAMPNGGTIKLQMMSHETNLLKIRFIDQGYGISKERMKRIGEPFYSTKEKGTGLGLTITNKIVKEHGGKINIESTVNQGTTVEIMLPINLKLQ